ncbi:Vacuolar ATPase assembly integral membrane protein vma21 [Penicillium diatomitis]|uniref:Vacuolar ATPase assembly integral membrane protein vma21 n=1 Tax=Penicillium diatomitis TaxID=2819901 RepID=A0A9W9WU33_9EURO|nr:Vacuolar ATPase assembly integral membrane protein vma21 [Penicillium diatomitis]KAJ5475539.1 Vacuolar ATPase assembly integral membrane protein vma21 [Penicillium diatomitis]
MSARRPHGQSYADVTAQPAQAADSDTTPAVPADVIYKLLAFTAAMAIGPIGVYFLTVNSVFGGSYSTDCLSPETSHQLKSIGNSTYAGITAAVVANLVLFGYIYVAWLEDQGDRQVAEKAKSKKAQ